VPQAETAAEPKVMDASWPCKGYNGPQPWDADNPPTLTQNHLMVSSGTAGDEVVELAALLARLGYGTSISAGQNPHAIYDNGVSEAVVAFCRDFGVEEDPQVRRARTEDTVGPWIWEALTRAVHKQIAQEPAAPAGGEA
jgi:peptidoglycan hydrolase-like protein with peptidoglycan-binding domain